MKNRRPGRDAAAKTTGAARRHSQAGVKRVLVGVRIEERLVKVLKGLAELKNCALGELIEELALGAMEGRSAFCERNRGMPPELRRSIDSLKKAYGVDYSAADLTRR